MNIDFRSCQLRRRKHWQQKNYQNNVNDKVDNKRNRDDKNRKTNENKRVREDNKAVITTSSPGKDKENSVTKRKE